MRNLHLLLLQQSATPATNARAFPADEAVDETVLEALATGNSLPLPDRCLTSSARRAIQTAKVLGLAHVIESRIAECDFGLWRGKTVAEIAEVATHCGLW